jgi:DNA-binding NtrC family response regulator
MNARIKMVLIDDNQVFRSLLKNFANARGISLTCFSSVLEMGSICCFNAYDIAIVESEHGTLSGVEVGEYLTTLMSGLPLILISEGLRPIKSVMSIWPKAIKGFIHKDDGPDAILNQALSAQRPLACHHMKNPGDA